MTDPEISRKLAVIVHADVAGSTALVQRNETLAHQRINDAFQRFSIIIKAYGGTVHEIRGDALVAEFARASDAVCAAIRFQQSNSETNAGLDDEILPVVRIGIALGEEVFANDTVTGAGVVLAQRVEQLAEPGGICVTGAIHEALPNHMPFDQESLGERKLKGFDEPVRVYRLALRPGESIPEAEAFGTTRAPSAKGHWIAAFAIVALVVAAGALFWFEPWVTRVEPASPERMAFPLPAKPSIAVLPFSNLSGDQNQEYFSDGLTNDIITDLSKFKNLFVIASNSTFGYKGKAVKIRHVAEELGVRYVLEGSVQRSGESLRINAQLIDATKGHHLWAERYERNAGDFFTIQEDIVRTIVASLAFQVQEAEIERALKKDTQNLEAYDLYQRGRKAFRLFTKGDNDRARQLFERAIELDPGYARAHSLLSWVHANNSSGRYRWGEDPERSLDLSLELAKKAVSLAPEDYYSHWALGFAYIFHGEFERAEAEYERALMLNPNDATVLANMVELLVKVGKPDQAIAQMKLAMRINPHHQQWYFWDLGWAQYFAGHYEDALESLNKMSNPANGTRRTRAAALVRLGRLEEAREVMQKFIETDLDMTLEEMAAFSWKDREGLKRWIDDLRTAGLPETRSAALPEKPSIAVLPFTNMSGDPEQEYFADGMTDDLITDLSKISGLLVIARNSTFVYKGKSLDVREVARDLNVRYVLEGSVRRAADQVRINAQLIDGQSGHHLWAERYDGEIRDIFALQDRMTRKIVSALAVELTPEEEAQTATQETDNIAAYDAFLQGWAHYNRQAGDGFSKAIEFFERAIELDPDYATASAALALSYWMGSEFGGLSKILRVSWRELRQRSRKYIDLAMKNPTAVSYMVASPAALKQRRYDDAVEYAQRAVQLDSNNAEAHRALSYALFYANRAEAAIETANRAIRLDPGNRAIPLQYIGRAHFALGHYEQAVEFIGRARDINPKVTPHSAMLAAALAHLGRDEEARAALEKYNASWGYTPSVREVMYFWPFKDAHVARRFAEGLVKAGTPPPPSGYYVLSDQERLKPDEIRALVFDRTVTGFDPWSGEQWWITRDADGQSSWRGTAEKSWSGPSVDADRGVSWIEGNLLCERWEVQDFQICLPLFRNPDGAKEGNNEYLSIYDTGIYPWSLVE